MEIQAEAPQERGREGCVSPMREAADEGRGCNCWLIRWYNQDILSRTLKTIIFVHQAGASPAIVIRFRLKGRSSDCTGLSIFPALPNCLFTNEPVLRNEAVVPVQPAVRPVPLPI